MQQPPALPITFTELSESLHEDLNGNITRVEHTTDGSYRVWLECDDGNDTDLRRCFQLRFQEAVETRCDTGWCGQIAQHDSHVLLWKHNEPQETVYFASAPDNPEAVIGRIYETHRRLFKGWRDMDECWHATSQMLRQGNGLLFRSARSVADAYCAVLDEILDYSRVAAYTPRGGYTCYLLENHFVIARGVSVLEVPVPVRW